MEKAQKAFEQHKKTALARLAQLSQIIRDTELVSETDKRNWAFAGTMGHVCDELGELFCEVRPPVTPTNSQAPEYWQWLEQVTEEVKMILDITNGDAQGMVEAQDETIQELWKEGTDSKTAANIMVETCYPNTLVDFTFDSLCARDIEKLKEVILRDDDEMEYALYEFLKTNWNANSDVEMIPDKDASAIIALEVGESHTVNFSKITRLK